MKCEEFKKEKEIEFNCCQSCHEDEDMGFGDDLWFEIPYDKDWNICCAAEQAWKKKHEYERDKE
jgi:hypothetical protein